MSPDWRPREAQQAILAYRGGRMAVAAVPGSGKTRTIAALATELLRAGIGPGRRVLVVTYQHAAAGALAARIGADLSEAGLPPWGYEVRTLHSLAHAIVAEQPGLAGLGADFEVADEATRDAMLDRAASAWRQAHPEDWSALQTEARRLAPAGRSLRLGGLLVESGRAIVRGAKNLGLGPAELDLRMATVAATELSPFLRIGAWTYRHYQRQLEVAGLLDFDDLVRLAAELLGHHPDLAAELAHRWPYVLEDEAQDSVPLQEALLGRLTATQGEGPGNWVRVGDPNQAVTSSFTAADPSSLRRFLELPDVTAVRMDESGRNARPIIDLANHLVEWTRSEHPLPEVRHTAFLDQRIRPTGPDDPQTNPEQGQVVFRVWRDRDAELDAVVARASALATRQPELSLAILVGTNAIGAQVARRLRERGQPFDERLQGSAAARQVASLLAAALSALAEPLRREHLVTLFDALVPLQTADDPLADVDPERMRPLLRSCAPEQLLYPEPGSDPRAALPPVPGLEAEALAAADGLARRLRRWHRARSLPIDQLLLTIAQDVLRPQDQALAQRLAQMLRQIADREPERLLPELAAELRELAVGRRRGWIQADEIVFEPRPGVITLTTMHKAKGLEWDLVYLVGVDGDWFPHLLEDRFQGAWQWLGADPAAEARAALLALVGVPPHPGRSPTDAAHIELIAERLRLLYVGITRARRWLSIGWSQGIPTAQGTPRPVPMAEVWRELKRFAEAG
ncbi:MAG: ATP-dependent helicase [Caldilineae bacterium]|nr:ATP-dependent helicase [Caldilineae bacterium]